MIAVNVHACPQNHPCPAVQYCPEGAIIQKDIYSAPYIDDETLHRVRRVHQGLPRLLQGPGRGPGRLMAHFDLICKDCGHKFVVVTRAAIRDKQKRCPECESDNVRQSFGSYLAERAALQPHLRRPPAQQRLRLRLLTRRRVAPSPQRSVSISPARGVS